MTEFLNQLFAGWGFADNIAFLIAKAIILLVILISCLISFFIMKKIILKGIRKFISFTKTKWDDYLVKRGVFKRFPHIAPAIVLFLMLPLALKEYAEPLAFFQRAALAYLIASLILMLDALLESIHDIYNTFEIAKIRPIKSYIQLVKIFIYIIGIVLVVTTILNINPLGILSGIGAMTAILLLVFKDSIMGLVSSIQLAGNNMIHIGDWIEMPKYGADGEVIEINLQSVKVRNWDKTITTIPTYSLVADSFKNWRGMSESGGRRIKRSLNIDLRSVHFLSEQEIEKLKQVHYLKKYISGKLEEITQWNIQNKIETGNYINGRHLTNLGTFRAYIQEYLRHHPNIHDNMTFLVRYLPPTENGMPIEIYVFSNDQVWANYEAIQANIFDHLIASLPEFELKVFQNPGGSDFEAIADGLKTRG